MLDELIQDGEVVQRVGGHRLESGGKQYLEYHVHFVGSISNTQNETMRERVDKDVSCAALT